MICHSYVHELIRYKDTPSSMYNGNMVCFDKTTSGSLYRFELLENADTTSIHFRDL